MPDRARPYGAGMAPGALGGRQHDGGVHQHRCWASSRRSGAIGSAWRVDVPGRRWSRALLAISDLPQAQGAGALEGRGAGRASVDGRGEPKLGSLAELFGDPRWRRNAIVGMLLAFSGVVGLWGIGFFSFDLIRSVFRQAFRRAQGLTAAQDDRAAS